MREEYADALEAGGAPTLVVPTQDGVPITERMGWQGDDCVVAAQLAQPPSR